MLFAYGKNGFSRDVAHINVGTWASPEFGMTKWPLSYRLTESIQNLEKKNEDRKEAKIETFKDQMKLKSYEKNLEQKTKEVGLLNKETRELKDR